MVIDEGSDYHVLFRGYIKDYSAIFDHGTSSSKEYPSHHRLWLRKE